MASHAAAAATITAAKKAVIKRTNSGPDESQRRVLVTGGNGFIGSWLVHALLTRGYLVTATYQLNTPISHLLTSQTNAQQGALLLLPADLLDAAAIRAAAAAGGGARGGVFHVASPCTLEAPADPENELVQPAVQGTLNVLEAAREIGAKRVVLTSSISAMVPNPKWSGKPVDESSWTDLDYCRSRGEWYPVSKVLAEMQAWEYAKKNGMDIVTINPSTVLGPLLQPGLNASSAVLQQLLQGSENGQGDYWLGAVHVQDVVEAQILLLESPQASGRHLCTNGTFQFKDFAARVASLCPEYNVHRFERDTQPWLVPSENAARKLINLGLSFRSLDSAIKEAEVSLRGRGFLNPMLVNN